MKKIIARETEKKVAPIPEDLYEEIEKRVEEAIEQTEQWRSTQEKWHNMRMRIKQGKTFPFPGCANLRLPTIETKLRKIKSQIVKIIFSLRPIVQAIPSPSGTLEQAMKIEKWVDHLIMDIMDFKPKAVIGVDQCIEKGFYLFKAYFRQEIITRMEEFSLKDLSLQEVQMLFNPQVPDNLIKQELVKRFEVDLSDLVAEDNIKTVNECFKQIHSGKESFKFELKDVVYNYPDIDLCNPEFVYVPSDSGWDPLKTRLITHEFYLPYDTVKKNVDLKEWSKSAVDDINAVSSTPLENLTDLAKEVREGISRLNNPSNLVKIWEVYCWYDLNKDGKEEKCLFTFAPDFGVTLRKITLPESNAKFPFVKIVNELCDDRWFSHRGLPEMIEDLVKEVDTQHNQKIDSQTLRNAPMISYRAGIVNPNLIKFTPAQAIPRQSPDDIQFMNNTNLNAEFSYKDEQMILEMKIEELIGQMDFGLQSMVNRRQPRTAFEVNSQVQSSQLVFSLDADLYTEAFSKLFQYVFDLWCQYGNDREEFLYFGDNGWEKIRLNREEVQGKYKIIIRGNDQNFNTQQRQQKAQMIAGYALNPLMLQSGVVQPRNLYNISKRFFQTLDEPNWQDFLTDPTTLPPPTPPPPPVKLESEDLTPAELADVKTKQNIQPDVQGMALKHADERAKEALDAQEQEAKIYAQIEKGRNEGKEPRSPRSLGR